VQRSTLIRRAGALAAAFASLVLVVGQAPAASAEPLPVTYNVAASLPYVLQPNKAPAGSNRWSCQPSAAHPRPVVLVNGTFTPMGLNWSVLAPLLANNGYCVFAFNYGATFVTTLTGGNISSIDRIDDNAAELKAFVAKVLTATSATKVDIVGHSQGGMMPNYYLKFLGGASKVGSLVGLAPSNHGTDLFGIVNFGYTIGTVFPALMPSISLALSFGGLPAAADQVAGSKFMQKMATLPDTVAGVKYTTIVTKYDEVVTPYQSQYLNGPNVTNLLLQDKCDKDHADHIAVAFDHIALQYVLNALDPANARTPVCSTVLPLVGG